MLYGRAVIPTNFDTKTLLIKPKTIFGAISLTMLTARLTKALRVARPTVATAQRSFASVTDGEC